MKTIWACNIVVAMVDLNFTGSTGLVPFNLIFEPWIYANEHSD